MIAALLVLGCVALLVLALSSEAKRLPAPHWARFRGVMRLPPRLTESPPLSSAELVLSLRRKANQ